MRYLFSKSGQQLLESLSFTKCLYAFDFDGTLAPIVEKPADARCSHETENLLAELHSTSSILIISGRSVADLRKRLDFDRRNLIGNHGLEGISFKKSVTGRAEVICRRWKSQLLSGWRELQNDPGVFVEDKTYSLALHYRRSRNKRRARLALLTLIGQLQPAPRVIMGKSLMNLIPSGSPHKGVALLEAMMAFDTKCALYIGDDDTDEDVFALPDSRVITVRIGQKKSSQAQYYLRRQSEINRLLRYLIRMNGRGL